ncbi:hypothetical protein Tco_0999637 [Tanacetum coccineum]
MNEQSHYKQDKTKTRQSINVKSHIFNVIRWLKAQDMSSPDHVESPFAYYLALGIKGPSPHMERVLSIWDNTQLAVHNIKKREGESARAFVTRYTDDNLQILGLHEEQHIFRFVHGLKTKSLMKFLFTDLPTTYKGLMEKTYTRIETKEVTTNGAPNDHRESFDRLKKNSSWDNNKGSKNKDRFSLYRGSNHGLLSNLSKSSREILATEKTLDQRSLKIKATCPLCEGNKERKGKGFKYPTRCVDVEERIVVNDKYPKQTVVIRRQLQTIFKKKLRDLLISNADIFAWTYKDMTRIPRILKTVKEIQSLNKKLVALS